MRPIYCSTCPYFASLFFSAVAKSFLNGEESRMPAAVVCAPPPPRLPFDCTRLCSWLMRAAVGRRTVLPVAQTRSSESLLIAARSKGQWLLSSKEKVCISAKEASCGGLKTSGMTPWSQPIMTTYFLALFFMTPLIPSVLTALASAAAPP